MKNTLLTISLLLLILTLGCLKQIEPKAEDTTIPPEKTTSAEEPKPQKTLSELQTTACNTADKAQTCNSRLVEVGIVTPKECCNILGKCC